MQGTRLTIRLPLKDVRVADMFVRSGEFSTRSEFIRRAVKEYAEAHVEEIMKKAEKMKKLQELVNAYEANEKYLKK